MATRVNWRGAEVTALIRAAAVQGLTDAADHLLQASTAVAPIESTALVDSAVASVDPDRLRAAVSYDGENAVRQHETLDYRHDSGKQAKYLEQPAAQETSAMRDLIATPIREVLS